MAKDPAFLFYDGDAAKDVSHMNRLERGCYFDLIQLQRKCGRMEESKIKKMLGKDFEACWDTLKICLTYDNHMYFIYWLEESIKKRQAYSESRRNNKLGKKRTIRKNISSTYVNHMENENRNENETKINKELDKIELSMSQKETVYFDGTFNKLKLNEDLRPAWHKWVDFNDERGDSITLSTVEEQLKYLSTLTVDNAKEKIRIAIARKYKGLEYETNGTFKRQSGASPEELARLSTTDYLERQK